MITPMMPGNASAAFMPNLPSSDAKALSLFLSHSYSPFSSLGEGGPPDATVPPGSNASTSKLITITIAMSMEAITLNIALLSKQHSYFFSQ